MRKWEVLPLASIILAGCGYLIQPDPTATPSPFVCPTTEPNGSQPPGESVESPDYFGNGQLWTNLWPDGITRIDPDQVLPDGRLGMKFPWWRVISGKLTIEGQRLDGTAPTLEADVPDGYGDTGFQVSGIIFPGEGCWQVTGKVSEALLTFVTQVVKARLQRTNDEASAGLHEATAGKTGQICAPGLQSR